MRQARLFDVNVGGVDEMQGTKDTTSKSNIYFLLISLFIAGREFKVVLISTVRARQTWHMWKAFDTQHQLGFISDPKRLNTAMTRAQSLLVFVGDPYVLYR